MESLGRSLPPGHAAAGSSPSSRRIASIREPARDELPSSSPSRAVDSRLAVALAVGRARIARDRRSAGRRPAPLALVLVYATALRLGGRVFAAWAPVVWVVLPFVVLAYATPSLRHDYAQRFLPHVLGLADDPRFPAMVAFLAAVYFDASRSRDRRMRTDVAIAVASAGIGAAFAPRAALVAVAPVAGLAVAGRRLRRRRRRHSQCCLGVVAAPSPPAARGAVRACRCARAGHALATLSENFWSGRVLEWLAIAGIAGALRGGRAAGDDRRRAPRGAPLGAGRARVRWNATSSSFTPSCRCGLGDTRRRRRSRCSYRAGGRRAQQPPSSPRGRRGGSPRGSTRAVATQRPTHGIGGDARPDPLWARAAIACLFVLIAFVGVWNAARYPIMLGYDAQEHITYADGLIHNGTTPTVADGGEYYAPPGYYAIAGAATWIGGKVGLVGSAPGRPVPQRRLRAPDGGAAARPCAAALSAKTGVWVGSLAFFAFYPSSRRRRRCSIPRR